MRLWIHAVVIVVLEAQRHIVAQEEYTQVNLELQHHITHETAGEA